MAAQTYGSTQTLAVVPRVNLLPPEIAEKATLRKAQVAMLATGVGAVAVLGLLYLQATAKVSSAESEKQQALTAHTALQGQLARLDNVKKVYEQVDVANKTLATAMHYDIRWSSYLHDLTLTIPENVWLETMHLELTTNQAVAAAGSEPVLDPNIGVIKFKGSAFSHDDVAAWLQSLAKQKGYADPYFTKSEDRLKSRVIVDFESTTYITEKALSKRYAKGIR